MIYDTLYIIQKKLKMVRETRKKGANSKLITEKLSKNILKIKKIFLVAVFSF